MLSEFQKDCWQVLADLRKVFHEASRATWLFFQANKAKLLSG